MTPARHQVHRGSPVVPTPRTADRGPGAAPIPAQRNPEAAAPAPPGSGPVRPSPPRPSRSDVTAIRSSCIAVRERPVALAEVFYAHLFDLAPATRTMFPADMTDQMRKMTDTLLGAVAVLHDAGDDAERVAALELSLHRLGAIHRDRWQVQPEHYLYIAHALTRAVRDVAGPAWSGSLSSSWIALTQWITAHMMLGAGGPDAP